MTGGVSYDATMPYELDRRWRSQAGQMTALMKEIGSAPIDGLPAVARDAARTFLEAWERTAIEAKVASEVYADELRETGTSYENLDAEVARRMAGLRRDAQ